MDTQKLQIRLAPGLIYLAQPIDQTFPANWPQTRIADLLTDSGISCYRPSTAFGTAHDSGDNVKTGIDLINGRATEICDAIIAILPADTPTLGVPVEVQRFLDAGKAAVIFCDRDIFNRSVQIRSWVHAGAHVYPFDSLPTARELPAILVSSARHARSTAAAAAGLPYTILDVQASQPRRTYHDDAGIDLAASAAAKVAAGESAYIPTGLAFAIPEGYWGLILGRSSTWSKRKMLVIPAVIDSGWRGELAVAVHNIGPQDQVIEVGDRLGQLVVLPAFGGPLVFADSLPDHPRGIRGFGSSGQ